MILCANPEFKTLLVLEEAIVGVRVETITARPLIREY
jgi:hypothetical protein